MFNDNLFRANHFSSFINSLQIVTLKLTMSLLVQNKFVSSCILGFEESITNRNVARAD